MPFIKHFDKKYPYRIEFKNDEYDDLYGTILDIIYCRMTSEDGKWIYLSVADKRLIREEINESNMCLDIPEEKTLVLEVVSKILEIRDLEQESLKIIAELYPYTRDVNIIVEKYLRNELKKTEKIVVVFKN